MIKALILDFLDDDHAIVRFDRPLCFRAGHWIACSSASPSDRVPQGDSPLLQEVQQLASNLTRSVEEVTQLVDETLQPRK